MNFALVGRPIRLSESDLAEREGVSVHTIRYWIKKGCAPKDYKLGQRRFFDLEDVLLWEASRKNA